MHLFVLVIKKRQTRKSSSLYQGPFTVIDKVNYYVQLIGGTQMCAVHHNQLKFCLSDSKPETANVHIQQVRTSQK